MNNKQTVLKEVAYFLQQEDTNGSYVEYLEEDMQQENINKILSYYKDLLKQWAYDTIEEKEYNLYMKYYNMVIKIL